MLQVIVVVEIAIVETVPVTIARRRKSKYPLQIMILQRQMPNSTSKILSKKLLLLDPPWDRPSMAQMTFLTPPQ